MNTRASASNLAQSLKELALKWEQSRNHWRDAKAQEFEKAYFADLPGYVGQARLVMEELDTILRKLRNDCE